MAQEPRIPLRLRELCNAVCDEIATKGQIDELECILRTDESARQSYWDHCRMHVDLYFAARERKMLAQAVSAIDETEVKATGPAVDSVASRPTKSPVLGFLGGAIDYVNHSRMLMFWLIALMVSGWFAFHLGSLMLDRARQRNARIAGQSAGPNSSEMSHRPGGPFANSAHPRQGDPVASLTANVDCHWRVVAPASPTASAPAPGDADTSTDTGEPFHVGDELFAGQQLDLARGLAEITFRSGAKILLNGPAQFTVSSPLTSALQAGKLTAKVPHDAHGFTVESRAGKVIDLGTEFGVAVAPDHSMVVNVFVGEVAVDSAPDGQALGSSERVTAGHAARVVAGKPVDNIPPQPGTFVKELPPHQDIQKAQAAYLDKMRSLKPVVWFRMEGQGTDRILHDEMNGPDAKLFWEGSGNPFGEGRLGKSLWVHGTTPGDCAIVPNYPQAEHDKLSVSAWVYADSRPWRAQAVSNWSNQSTGQFQFGLSAAGVDLSVSSMGSDGRLVEAHEGASHPFPLREWQFVAFTIDGKMMRLYRQGNEVAHVPQVGLHYPVHVRALAIGDMVDDAGQPLHTKRFCQWDGRLDEIAVFNDVLSPEDIKALATAPPQ